MKISFGETHISLIFDFYLKLAAGEVGLLSHRDTNFRFCVNLPSAQTQQVLVTHLHAVQYYCLMRLHFFHTSH